MRIVRSGVEINDHVIAELRGLPLHRQLRLADADRGRDEGAKVSYHDPHIPELPEHGLESQELDGSLAKADCVAIVTAHSGIDYDQLAERAQLVVDFRNATGKNGSANGRVWKL